MNIRLEDHYPKWSRTPLNKIMSLMNFILIASGIIMALTFFFVVILRYIFHADLFAYEEWLMMIAFWMFFLGGAVATHDQKHIKADIIGFLITNPKTLYYRALFVYCIELVILIVIVYWGYLMISESIEAYPHWQETVALHIPFIIPRLGIVTGFFMMMVYTMLHIYALIQCRNELNNTTHSN